MKRIILGTAGHIDHGKTALVKALTGVDCDRLKEEKLRGITIELGFASLALPGGLSAGIIDVPGHEKFIKNMVAGTGGIDAVLLIIAADEGIMPQTREHLDICRLLGIRRGLVALTKSDLVDADWLSMVSQDIAEFIRGSFLEVAPVLPVSSVTGAGLPELRSALAALIAEIDERSAGGIFRMPVDRVFSMKGFGTVVTGTPLAGSVAAGQEIEILPGGIRAKLRGIQVHNEPARESSAGMRTALNLQGVDRDVVERGSVIAQHGVLKATLRAAAWLDHLASAPLSLKNRGRVRLHAGAAEIGATVILLDADELAPGAGGYVQFVLDAPAALLPGDRYVIRNFSPVFTIGGGEILDNSPPRLKRFALASRERLAALRSGSADDAILLFCREAGMLGAGLDMLTARLGASDLLSRIALLRGRGDVLVIDEDSLLITLPEILRRVEDAVTAALRTYHSRNPLKPGPLRDELRALLPRSIDARLLAKALDRLEKSGLLRFEQEFIALAEHVPVLKEDEKSLRGRMLGLYCSGGSMPPTVKEILEELRAPAKEIQVLLGLLVREGRLVKVAEDLYYEAAALQDLVKKTIELAGENHAEITLAGFKDATGLTRKFMIPLLEYFDKIKLTMRTGDKRILRKQA